MQLNSKKAVSRMNKNTSTNNASLRWTTMLLALSSTASLTTHSSKSVSRSFQPELHRRNVGCSSRVFLTLQRGLSTSRKTKLLYAGENIEDDEYQVQSFKSGHLLPTKRIIISKLSSFWFFLSPFNKQSQTIEDEEQQNFDDYLVFLDKRYNRIHEDDDSPSKIPKKRFSTWDWLMDNKKETDPLQSQNDALFVLGVSELASERLRSQYYLANPQKPKLLSTSDAIVITTKATTIQTPPPMRSAPPAMRAAPLPMRVAPAPRRAAAATSGLFGRRTMSIQRKQLIFKAKMRAAFLKLKAKNDSLAVLINIKDLKND